MRLAHITDLHLRHAIPGTAAIGIRRSRSGLAHLERVLKEAVAKGIDFIAITGDLLDVPHFLFEGVPAGFIMPGGEEWEAWVRRDYLAVKALLDATGVPYRVLPGNHDLLAVFREVFPGHDAELHCGGYRIVSFHDHEHEGNVPRRYSPSRLLFDAVLSDDDRTPQIHLQHYLFSPIAGASYPYHYAEYEFLRKKIEASGRVSLCLSGHYHKGLYEPGATTYAVGPAFCHSDRVWRIYEVDAAGVRFETFSITEEPPAPVVFLDRDGVINDLAAYYFGPEEMRLIPGVGEAIRRLNAAGIQTVVVTSQSAIGHGFVPESVVRMVNERMCALLAAQGAHLDAIYYTKSAGEENLLAGWEALPTAKSAIVWEALEELPLDHTRSWIVGDRLSDLQAGAEAGLRGKILVRTGWGIKEEAKAGPDAEIIAVADLSAAVELVLSQYALAC